jgi:enoyl-CoA hydratase
MNDAPVIVEHNGAVAVVTVNRPEKRNALSARVREESVTALDEREADDGVRVVVLTGAGDKAFVAGADLEEFAVRSAAEQREAMSGRTVFDALAGSPKPTLAMINGLALGGGCELALACDIRIAGKSARLGQPEIRLGLIPGGGGTQRLPRLVGIGRAMWLILSGELVAAEEAQRMGLVDLVVPDEELRDRTLSLANAIAERSPVALRNAKQAIRATAEMPLTQGLGIERELFLDCFASEDGREGVAAFLEKRSPELRGR